MLSGSKPGAVPWSALLQDTIMVRLLLIIEKHHKQSGKGAYQKRTGPAAPGWPPAPRCHMSVPVKVSTNRQLKHTASLTLYW